MPPPTLFADTFYWVAVLNPRDPFHARVMSWGRNLGTIRLVTTDEVLTEVLNWFSGAGPYWRGKAATSVHNVRNDPGVDVLPQSRGEFRRRPRAVRGPARQGVQRDRLPVDGRPAGVGADRGFDQRSSFQPGRLHDPVSDALNGFARTRRLRPAAGRRSSSSPARRYDPPGDRGRVSESEGTCSMRRGRCKTRKSLSTTAARIWSA